MPRNPEKNAMVREARKTQILDAALSVYIHTGYHGTDMDAVAEEAGLAKGLLYYYYKTKKELFAELYTVMFTKACDFSDALIAEGAGMKPVEQLVHYTYGMFCANKEHPRMMRFSIRIPFDAYGVFGPDEWKDGAKKSDLHRRALTTMIERGIMEGEIPKTDPSRAANSFWSVFVANLFEYSKLIMGEVAPLQDEFFTFTDTITFCFQGLGVESSLWKGYVQNQVDRGRKGGPEYEGL